MRNQKNLLQRLDETPPFMVFYLIRRNGRRPPLAELSQSCGLSVRSLQRLSTKFTWADIRVGTVCALMRLSGIRGMSTWTYKEYLKQTMQREQPWAHLRRAPGNGRPNCQLLRQFEHTCRRYETWLKLRGQA